MKTKLLKKLRNIGRNEINILSVTKSNGTVTGMRVGYNDDIYSKIFSYGDTEDEVRNKAMRRYLENNIDWIRQRYSKYSRKNRK